VAFASADASSWVTSWQGSSVVGFSDPVGDAGAEAVGGGVGVGVRDGDAGADVAGGSGGSAVGVTGTLDDGAGAVDAGAIADTFGWSVVTLLLLDDLQDVISKAGVMTTRMSAARRCISGVSVNVVLCGRSQRLKMKSPRCTSVADYVRHGANRGRRIQQVLSDVSCGVQHPVGKWMKQTD
jgi:hypothetical protein